jgi:hypothetical protein
MTLTALLNKYGINHFSEHELRKASSDPIPEELFINIIPTLLIADKMRKDLGFPICINSAYRNAEHNKKVGGSETSLHLQFNALDIRPCGYDKEKLKMMKDYLRHQAEAVFNGDVIDGFVMGIGWNYDSFIHIDTRGMLDLESPKRW